jgi:hypothetical protein
MNSMRISTSGFGVREECPGQVQDKIRALKEIMRAMPQVEIVPRHVFAPGMYARQILIPAETILTGKVHKQDDLQIMIYGDITIKTEAGQKRLEGFNMFTSKAGYQQIGRAHADTLWVTVHSTSETDLDKLEQELFEDEPDVIDFKTGKPNQDAIDYHKMLLSVGISPDTAWSQSINESDRIDVEIPGISLRPSRIHGTGVFAEDAFSASDRIGMARVNGMRTQVGRYTNHSVNPNAKMKLDGDDIYLEAIRDIQSGDEITTNYRETLALSGIRGEL